MHQPVIELRNIQKSFRRFASRRAMIAHMLGLGGKIGPRAQEFRALQRLSLSIGRGETWGIVGRNGSGKSTLLQIIAGTLQPTSGDVQVRGRVAALLELGSGFHPEFTGRENVFFQGQIQGCGKPFIDERFDEIVGFANIGDFLDQPVKTYSSGMKLRLAFACTIALDPDILIVDEALAVGDEAFQRKCFARIKNLQDRGCTVLFVSHAGHQIIELCDHALLLDSGEPLLVGEPKRVVSQYHRLIFSPQDKLDELRAEIRSGAAEKPAKEEAAPPVPAADQEDFFDPGMKPQSTLVYPSLGARIDDARLQRPDHSRVNLLKRGRSYAYCYDVHFQSAARLVRFGMLVKTVGGFELGGAVSHTLEQRLDEVPAGATVSVRFEFPCALQPGIYFLNAGVTADVEGAETFLHRVVDAAMFRVQPEPAALATGALDLGFRPAVEVHQSQPETESVS